MDEVRAIVRAKEEWDIKAVTAMGAFAATAITALTAQNTEGVHGVVPVEPAFIAQQIEVVLTDIGADSLKTGMLHSAEVITTVAASFGKDARGVPLVVDPVMISKSGHALLTPDAIDALKKLLFPLALVVTPNIHEAQQLSGLAIENLADARRAALAVAATALLAVFGAHAGSLGGYFVGDDFAFVGRYAGFPFVKYFSVWNEPNLNYEWGNFDPDPARYGAMLKAAYPSIKAADPAAVVVTGGLSPTGDGTSGPYLGDLYYLNRLADLLFVLARHEEAGFTPARGSGD